MDAQAVGAAGPRNELVEIELRSTETGTARHGEPITLGVPLPRGMLFSTQSLAVVGSDEVARPLQARALDHWSDGSLRWVLLDFTTSHSGSAALTLSIAESPAAPRNVVTVQYHDDACCVDTGAAVFRVSRVRFWFDEVTRDGVVVAAGASGFAVRDGAGHLLAQRVSSMTVEESGPVRAVVALRGEAGAPGETRVDLIVRLHFFAGLPTVKCVVTVRNSRRAAHPGGYWDLGDEGSIYLREVTLSLAPAGGHADAKVVCSPERGTPYERVEQPFRLYQDSSGGRHWQSTNHVNREGKVALQFRGYRLRSDAQERDGERATPVVGVVASPHGVAVAVPDFWENFPKAVSVASGTLAVHLFPADGADVHEIQGGEQKTHTFFVGYGADGVSERALDWCRSPSVARLPASWYRDAEPVPFVGRKGPGDDPYERLVDAAIDGPEALVTKREIIDEFGWRHFGEIYSDHEAVRHEGPAPLVSHYNNQYDAIAGFAIQFFRSGDRRWWKLMQDLASHVVDIDVYHTTEDKAAYNNGLFWHTDHYVDAATATHRTYARSKASGGGGPSSEHNYTTGLMLHYFMTGDVASRDTVVGLARWVAAMEDGSLTPFRFLASGYTGHATASGAFLYHGPGRGSANSVNALLDGHRLAPDEGFLALAETFIRRVIHPHDDIEARDLFDIERKWFYTIFLQVLAKYLDIKATFGQRDAMYAYARESLLHYARWMKACEYFYLDRPEKLEFPTESWAAQEMRKSEVFDFAAFHSEGAERTAFRERAAYFYERSLASLSTFATRSRARPLVIMLTNGFRHAWFIEHPIAAAPPPLAPPGELPPPKPFVPQKVIAKRRALILAAAIAMGAVAAIIATLF